jgi:hypothetical protein
VLSDWTWSFRLQLRVRGRTAPRWLTATCPATINPADYSMAGRMLRGIKRRAESGAVMSRPVGHHCHPKRGNSMTLRERTLGIGMRRRLQTRVDRLSLPTAPLRRHRSRTRTSRLFPARLSDTCGLWV